MKKRYGLDNIIGKRSKLRYPSHISSPKTHLLYFIIPANDAIAEPPLNTNITLRKGDPLEFCDQFNDESYEFEEGVPLNTIVYISPSEQLFEIKSPTITSLLGIVFDLEDMPLSFVDASLRDISLAAINFGLIQLNPNEDFFLSDLINKVPSIYGSLFSFNRKFLYAKQANYLVKKRKPKRYLKNTSSEVRLRKIRLHKLKLYIKSIKDYPDHHVIQALINGFYYNLQILNVWQEDDELIWVNSNSNIIADFFDYVNIASALLCIEQNLDAVNPIKNTILLVDSLLSSINNSINVITGPTKIPLGLINNIFSSANAIHYDIPSVFDEDYGISIIYKTILNNNDNEIVE